MEHAMNDRSELGRRVKKVRESRHLTLKKIEAKAGISATHISEIERGKTSPTLGALIRISDALGKDPAYFVEDNDLGDSSVVTVENRVQESLANSAGTFERLTASIPGGRLQGRIVTLNPGKAVQAEHEHQGQEAVLVLAGSVGFTVAGNDYILAEGDTISYSAAEAHSFRNASDDAAATLVWFCSERGAS
jgi:transcriptional regulator with XRE-family HTH domain